LIKLFGLSGFFNRDLGQFRIKSALFTFRNPDFSVLPRCCVLKVHWLVSRKICQLSDATQVCSQSPTSV